MPFKIVQTIENSEKYLSVVPSKWENDGILHWPKSGISAPKLQRDENSTPLVDWVQMCCVRKRNLIRTYDEAEEEIKRMLVSSDTDTDELEMREKPSGRPKRLKTSTTANQASKIFDFNNLLDVTITDNITGLGHQNNNNNDPIICNKRSNDKIIILENEMLQKPMENVMVLDGHQGFKQNKEDPEVFTLETNFQSLLLSNQQTIIENQTVIMSQQAKLQTMLETAMELMMRNNSTQQYQQKKIDGPNGGDKEANAAFTKEDYFPIDNIETFHKVEEKLGKDSAYELQIIDTFSIICGQSGKENGFDVCYKLIDYLFDRKFVNTFSWTGNSREGPSKAKNALKFFTNFRHCFLQIVRKADRDFSDVDFEKFLKRVLKNSSQRKTGSKVASTHKNRPIRIKKTNFKLPNGLGDETVDNICIDSNKIIMSSVDEQTDDSEESNE